ncbi:hypothetical protein L2E82_44537 [Cichorium intybus]|uniref:Uncharacterized protein n=1 Tax=Cichorium intybus TaxID=13427 RepID=A0ACB8ZPM6_CICIN|nr:hypothetical protein L2E82_44537 [Cichorium intybus]
MFYHFCRPDIGLDYGLLPLEECQLVDLDDPDVPNLKEAILYHNPLSEDCYIIEKERLLLDHIPDSSVGMHGSVIVDQNEKEAENYGNPDKESNAAMISEDDVDLFDLYLNVDGDDIIYYVDTEVDYQQNIQADYETYIGEQLA